MAVPMVHVFAALLCARGTQEAGLLQTTWPWLVLGAACVVLLILFVAFAKYLRISLRLFMNTQMPMTADLAAGQRVTGEVHEFPSRDGTSLMGVFIDPPAGAPVRGTIVFSHEFNGDRHGAARYTAGLTDLGFRVFTFDYRGHGASSNSGAYQPSHWVTDYEVNDLLAAVAYVEATTGQGGKQPVGIMGVSRGACAAAIAALHTPRIRTLVLDGVFSTDVMVEGLMKRWATIFSSIELVRPNHPAEAFGLLRVFTILYAELKLRCRYPIVRKAIARLKDVPVLFIYGNDDAYIDGDHRIKLYRAKPGGKQLWEVHGAKHNQGVVVNPEGYRRETAAFLDRYMPPVDAEGALRGG